MSDLIEAIIAYLPNLFAAVVILVIVAALAKVVTDLLAAALGTVSGGEWIARAAGMAILVIGVFAALNQLQIAPEIVNGLFYALLAIIVGVAIVAFGGGGISVARRYWERASVRVETKASESARGRADSGPRSCEGCRGPRARGGAARQDHVSREDPRWSLDPTECLP